MYHHATEKLAEGRGVLVQGVRLRPGSRFLIGLKAQQSINQQMKLSLSGLDGMSEKDKKPINRWISQ